MPELSFRNLEEITLDIRRQEITFSHLSDELIDHICCDVENEMQTGLTFREAYDKVKKRIGPRRIKEIQEETLYAVDTKYRIMKNLMKISGVAGTTILSFGVILKIQHFPGAGILLTSGALILAFLFLPASLSVLWKETHNKKSLFLFLSAFLAGVLFIFGILFKIQHWPGAGIIITLAASSFILLFIPALLVSKLKEEENKRKRPVYILGAAGLIFYIAGLTFKIQHWPLAVILMISGVFIMSLFVLPWYTWYTWKDKNHIDARFIFLIVGSLLIVLPGALVNINLQGNFDIGFFKAMQSQQNLFSSRNSSNEAVVNQYKDSLNYNIIESIHMETRTLLALIDNIQAKMVSETEDVTGTQTAAVVKTNNNPENTSVTDYRQSEPFRTYPVRDNLFPGSDSRKKLESALSSYMNALSRLTSEENVRGYNSLLEPSLFLPSGNDDVNSFSLISGLHSLELLKNSILTVESNMLAFVASK